MFIGCIVFVRSATRSLHEELRSARPILAAWPTSGSTPQGRDAPDERKEAVANVTLLRVRKQHKLQDHFRAVARGRYHLRTAQ